MPDLSPNLSDWLSDLLSRWRAGEIDEVEVHESAEQLFEGTKLRELPRTHPDSMSLEVLSHLEILNQQLIVIDDIPVMLDVLDLGRKDPKLAWARWSQYWRNMDFEVRKQAIRDNNLSNFYAV